MSKSFWLISAGIAALATPAYAQDTNQAAAPGGTEDAAQNQASDEGERHDRHHRPGPAPAAAGRAAGRQAVGADALQNSGANDIRQLNQLAPSLLVSSTGTEANGSARVSAASARSATIRASKARSRCSSTASTARARASASTSLARSTGSRCCAARRAPCSAATPRPASSTSSPARRRSISAACRGHLRQFQRYSRPGGDHRPARQQLAARLDAVYVNRDGFYHDVTNGGTVNDRDRFFVRGQLLFEPNSNVSFRLIGDYSRRNEDCCGAVYIDQT